MQYHDNKFWVGKGAQHRDYTESKTHLRPRKYLQVTGGQDTLIPADGGKAGVAGNLEMVPWQESVFAYARATGYTGELKQHSLAGANPAVSYKYGPKEIHSAWALNVAPQGHAMSGDATTFITQWMEHVVDVSGSTPEATPVRHVKHQDSSASRLGTSWSSAVAAAVAIGVALWW